MKTVTVLGAGSFGTALAAHLGGAGHEVRLWARDAALAADIARRRANPSYLPAIALPPTVTARTRTAGAAKRSITVLQACETDRGSVLTLDGSRANCESQITSPRTREQR